MRYIIIIVLRSFVVFLPYTISYYIIYIWDSVKGLRRIVVFGRRVRIYYSLVFITYYYFTIPRHCSNDHNKRKIETWSVYPAIVR